jgi:hypothetical protein
VNVARRLCSVALQCALLTMTVVGSGYACGMMDDDGMDGSMAGMADMPGMPMDASPSGSSDDTPPSPDCTFPWAPGACHQMSSCSPNAVTVAVSAIAALAVNQDGPAGRLAELRSVTRSPEPPPPKA